MNLAKSTIALLTCCCIILTIAPPASADFVGVTTAYKDDPETDFQCTQGNGAFVPSPLAVCNVFAGFDNPNDALLSVGNAELQVYNGAVPGVFYQHPLNFDPTSPACALIEAVPDLICDSFITIGYQCAPDPAGTDESEPDIEFGFREFADNGHIVGGWLNFTPSNGQGDAGTWPDLKVLFLQSGMSLGLTMSGDIDLFWWVDHQGETYAELDVPIECAVWKPDGFPCYDGDPCTTDDVWMDGVCSGLPVDCEDGNVCTDDFCDEGQCMHQPNNNPCPTDSDGDGDTDAADLAVLLGSWGPCGPGEPCECLDSDTSGSIDAFDLAVLLGAWGPCS